MIRAVVVMSLLAGALTACDAPRVGQNATQVSSGGLRPGDAGFSVLPPNAVRGPQVDAFAISILNDLQARSIIEAREYCGYIIINPDGRLSATQARAGSPIGCVMPEPRLGQGVIASYHTHGAFRTDRLSEVPSPTDLISDFNYGIDGFVSTPGGRIWRNNAASGTTQLLCGPRCVIYDQTFRDGLFGPIAPIYTIQDLRRRQQRL